MNVYLVRHAESQANREGIYQGQTHETPLSPVGRLQAQRTAKALTGLEISLIYTSPFLRAQQTADIIHRPFSRMWEIPLDNCGITTVKLSKPKLIKLNDVQHLREIRSPINLQAL